MSYPTRSLSSQMRAPSSSTSSASQSPALLARIEEKKAELQSLRELRDLSAAVSNQMEALEQKLTTLSDGTEAVAAVMGNWHNVLRAINMASSTFKNKLGSSTFANHIFFPQQNSQNHRPTLPWKMRLHPTNHFLKLSCEYQLSMHQHCKLRPMPLKLPLWRAIQLRAHELAVHTNEFL
ncbi:DASH complex subunit dad2 [Metarhizium acridum]|nr:DASH complex subunit dad2 [Metarhizium acridum]